MIAFKLWMVRANRASYFASLFKLEKVRRIAYVYSIPDGLIKISPSPTPFTLDAPSVYKVHILDSSSFVRLHTSSSFVPTGISLMECAKT
ncbi:hypothetical protein Tco_1483644 [Tanacetum coccineum]